MRRGDPGLLAAIAAGGAVGSLGRYAAGLALPHAAGAFPWATFLVNIGGSLAMGVLVVWVLSMDQPHPWLRPFLGVGVLGGWTTFSGYALDTHAMVTGGHALSGAAYVVGSLVVGLAAVGVGISLGERVFGRRP
ncbi:CrcB family protein [Nostocoides sp. HKS02]|uniref:fluoride efflux transporter FluC n=1 Tax=Nostocoides sp. HKS02 TaxID=1813880 RepID=UPI0012B46C78|nr:CrcB family protein [Tetrasphaera sp. HKS02]QGN58500.1 fluoride efflux transporter CrcB [Tetrasphaera sp. HKS02]